MKLISSAFAAVLFTLGAGAANAADLAAGKAVWDKLNCASCHGADAKGGTGPAIAGKPTSAIVGVVTSHPPPMNKIELTNDEIAAVSRYVSSLKK